MISVLAKRVALTLMCFVAVSGCATKPPKKTDNICEIFFEKGGWYKDARKAKNKWEIPIATNMAFMHQESRFVSRAKPPRTKILGFIPGPRKSSAYGYSQAKKETWSWYKKSSGNRGADRNDFDDAIDFIAWYNRTSVERVGVSAYDPYRLYLAYHEGHGGYKRGTYKKKPWLIKVAKKVSARANKYQKQLASCEKKLQSPWWWPF